MPFDIKSLRMLKYMRVNMNLKNLNFKTWSKEQQQKKGEKFQFKNM